MIIINQTGLNLDIRSCLAEKLSTYSDAYPLLSHCHGYTICLQLKGKILGSPSKSIIIHGIPVHGHLLRPSWYVRFGNGNPGQDLLPNDLFSSMPLRGQ